MKYRAILLFGAPGAGKGTQGKILGQIPNFVHFSCGDAFRNLRVDSQLGRVFVEYASAGRLVPDEPTIELWKRSIEGMTATGRFNPDADTMLLDGIPRNPRQAEPCVRCPPAARSRPMKASPGCSSARNTAWFACAPLCGCTLAKPQPNSFVARSIASVSATSTNSQPP